MPRRTQFTDPNLGQTESGDPSEDEGEFYENCDEDDEDEEGTAEEVAKSLYKMDPDHRLYSCAVPSHYSSPGMPCQCGDGHSPGVLAPDGFQA